MSRSVVWRRTCSNIALRHQEQAMSSTIYILREIGPTGFLLKEESQTKNVQVFLGDPHRCTCATFKKENDLCQHICWLLLKKFRVSAHDPISWQLGMVEREINELLQGSAAQQAQHSAHRPSASDTENKAGPAAGSLVPQREISEDDICPICQEKLLASRQLVTFCRHGCGNSVHLKCMKVWAEHQLQSTGQATIECPFCREDFGPLSALKAELRGATRTMIKRPEHHGVVCYECHVTPIVGKCYKCVMCADVYLCQSCFRGPSHTQHRFRYKEKPSQRWREAGDRNAGILPGAVISDLMQRDLSDQDYELLLQLDNQSTSEPSDLTEATVSQFRKTRVSAGSMLLTPGQQCRVCLHQYSIDDVVRYLPCQHHFHRACIDQWLLHRHPTCPVDGIVYTNESVRLLHRAQQRRREKDSDSQSRNNNNTAQSRRQSSLPASGLHLEVPCFAVGPPATCESTNRVVLTDHCSALSMPANSISSVQTQHSDIEKDAEEDVIINANIPDELAATLSTAVCLIDTRQNVTGDFVPASFSSQALMNDVTVNDDLPFSQQLSSSDISGVSASANSNRSVVRRDKSQNRRISHDRAHPLPFTSAQLLPTSHASTTADLLNLLGSCNTANSRQSRSAAHSSRHSHRLAAEATSSIHSSHTVDDIMLDMTSQPPATRSALAVTRRLIHTGAGRGRGWSQGRVQGRIRLQSLQAPSQLTMQCHPICNVKDLYIGNNPTTCLAELSEEQFSRPQPAVRQGSSILQRGQHSRPRGDVGRRQHVEPQDLSVLGNTLTTDSDGL